MAKKKQERSEQLAIDFTQNVMSWPSNDLFPLNIPQDKRTVLQKINQDVTASESYLVVTGFTSLAHLIDFLVGTVNFEKTKSIRIILGFEPEVRGRKSWGRVEFAKEIKDYWLDRGYSLFKGGNVIKTIEFIRADKVQFRILDHLHAKIYVGDTHVILGSANFSKNGLTVQQEANLRIPKGIEQSLERSQYDAITLIANNFFQSGDDYQEKIIDLLTQLIKVTQWQEALARAIVELLEGNWFKEFPELFNRLNSINLWPSQRHALGQALYILQTQGGVLIADPTGSGKTKLISTLNLLLFHWLWESGRKTQSYITTICPPIVQKSWSQEAVNIGATQNSPISMGLLSYSHNANQKNVLKQIKLADVLVIDEAHNYLNLTSNRSEKMSRHSADFLILSTATPINKRARDLLRLVELLGVDNLNDEELETLRRLKKRRNLVSIKEIEPLKGYIRKFIVRRTKKQLKNLIQKEPEQYRNRLGNLCQYPKTECITYPTGESAQDKQIATQINLLANQLKGLLYLRKLERSDAYSFVLDDLAYVEMRTNAAKALAIFNIQAKLRSSKVALVELVEGTQAASEYFSFDTQKPPSGNMVATLQKYRTSLPSTDFSSNVLPTWSTDLDLYQYECDQEIKIYKAIGSLAKTLSTNREYSKVEKMAKLFESHKLVIAFDSTIITLDYLKLMFTQRFPQIRTCVVTGNTLKDNALRNFDLGSEAENVLGLFSDCMSEGVNLQQASAMLFLDMPSVLRIAEQRIGRIDRLDSPHSKIQVYWPLDSDEFALRTDRKLVKASIDAEMLIGSNFEIPDKVLDKHMDEIVRPDEMYAALEDSEENDYSWEGMQDAFRPVHNLYSEEDALISQIDYEYFKGVDASVKSKICLMRSEVPWLFLATRGSKTLAPRWYFIDSDDRIFSDLSEVCRSLRQYLNAPDKVECRWNEEATKLLSRYFALLQKNEIDLLPTKRRRALQIAKFVLEKQIRANKDPEKSLYYEELLRLFSPLPPEEEFIVNYYAFAQQWLDILTPYLYEKRQDRRNRGKIISLNDLKRGNEYEKIQLSTEQLKQLLNDVSYIKSASYNVASCILGVPA